MKRFGATVVVVLLALAGRAGDLGSTPSQAGLIGPSASQTLDGAVEAYFAGLGVKLPTPNFLGLVPIRFRIRDASQRYHLPVLFTPWGYSYYRGS